MGKTSKDQWEHGKTPTGELRRPADAGLERSVKPLGAPLVGRDMEALDTLRLVGHERDLLLRLQRRDERRSALRDRQLDVAPLGGRDVGLGLRVRARKRRRVSRRC